MRRLRLPVSLLVLFLSLAIAIPVLAGYSADLSTSGNAISSGDAVSQAKGLAFDDTLTTFWESSGASAACVSGGQYIGQDFGSGVAYEIRRFWFYTAATSRGVTSVVVQTSSDGSSWSNAETVTIINDAVNHSYDLSPHGAWRYWRFLCNSVPTGAWRVSEIEMQIYTPETPTPTETPGATNTPTATLTPTATNTPDYFVIATFQVTELSAVGYPITVRPTHTYGDVATVAIGGVVAGLLFVSLIVALSWNRNIKVKSP